MNSEARADVLLVTATKVETRAVLDAFGVTGQEANPQSINGRVYFDLGTINGASIRLTQCEMGPSGLGGAQQAIGKGIDALLPAAVIMVGIAFGVDEHKQAYGDILITEQLRPYDLQRVGTDGDGSIKIILRDDKPHASPWLLNLFRSAEVTWEGARLRFGTVLTGAKLIDNIDFRDQLAKFEPEAIGGEMEGGGLYVACHDKKIDWILMKSICDFADGQKEKDKDERQAMAAKNAASFVRHALAFAKVDWQSHAPRAPLPAGFVMKPAEARPDASAIIARIHSGQVPLSACIADVLVFAIAAGDTELKTLCERELIGYRGAGTPPDRGRVSIVPRSEDVEHRAIEFFVSLGAEVNIDFFGSGQRAIAWMRSQPDDFPVCKFVYPEPIATIEQSAKEASAKALISLRMLASTLFPKAKLPDAVLMCYAQGDAYEQVLSRTRTLITKKLLRHVQTKA